MWPAVLECPTRLLQYTAKVWPSALTLGDDTLNVPCNLQCSCKTGLVCCIGSCGIGCQGRLRMQGCSDKVHSTTLRPQYNYSVELCRAVLLACSGRVWSYPVASRSIPNTANTCSTAEA